MIKRRIKPISDKQRQKNAHWKQITDEKCAELNYVCQWCGQRGHRLEQGFQILDGHHIIKRRYNIHTKENCYICHRAPCHREIEDNNIDVNQYPNREAWLSHDREH